MCENYYPIQSIDSNFKATVFSMFVMLILLNNQINLLLKVVD